MARGTRRITWSCRDELSVAKAPAEVEAELAVLSQHGLIDLVLTTDVDALVFGATCVARW